MMLTNMNTYLFICRPFDESVKLFLDGILYRRIDSLEDLISTLNLLKNEFLQSSEDVRLIVVDR